MGIDVNGVRNSTNLPDPGQPRGACARAPPAGHPVTTSSTGCGITHTKQSKETCQVAQNDVQDMFKAAREQLNPPLQPGEVVLQNCATGEVIRYATRQAYLRDNCDLYIDDTDPAMPQVRYPGSTAEPNEAIERFRATIRGLRA